MSNDWQPGDLALCVNNRPDAVDPLAYLLKVGHPYLVTVVGPHEKKGGCALAFRELPTAHNPKRGYAYCATRFIKVTPPEADEFDREVIDLMNQRERVA